VLAVAAGRDRPAQNGGWRDGDGLVCLPPMPLAGRPAEIRRAVAAVRATGAARPRAENAPGGLFPADFAVVRRCCPVNLKAASVPR
jgi:hypothetical protein